MKPFDWYSIARGNTADLLQTASSTRLTLSYQASNISLLIIVSCAILASIKDFVGAWKFVLPFQIARSQNNENELGEILIDNSS